MFSNTTLNPTDIDLEQGASGPSPTAKLEDTCATLSYEDIREREATHPVPPKAGTRVRRYLQWGFFSVYRRLFGFVFTVNVLILITLLAQKHSSRVGLTHANAATAASANLCVAISFRNEHVVNLMFLVATSVPHSLPLSVRRIFARIYGYGGIHSGCSVAAVAWYLVFAGLVTRDSLDGALKSRTIVAITYVILSLLISILVFAHPYMRIRLHNYFENVHRLAGWTAVGLFWTQTIVVGTVAAKIDEEALGKVLVQTPTFWFLIVITCCIVYPWARTRSRKVRPEYLSEHAIRLHFDYARVGTGYALRLSDAPLKETHSFAAIANPERQNGFSVVVSNAGDWTKRMIQDPPARLWVRGTPTIGVLRVALLFKCVVIVATGSGIGPCLSLFNSKPDHPVRILWSTPNPEATYGRGIIDSVLRADPNAVIVDTRKTGRVDMVGLTYSLYKEANAEAVVIISNPKVTRKVVYGMNTRGIPAFGPIFDS
ncbi:gramicidin s synthetase 1 [Cryomyces antarcticus]